MTRHSPSPLEPTPAFRGPAFAVLALAVLAIVLPSVRPAARAQQQPAQQQGQQPPPQQPAQQPGRQQEQQQAFRSETTLVEVDAIVTDKAGRFVPGLSADDFEVLEDGKPRAIQRMYVVSGNKVSGPVWSPVAPESPAAQAGVAPLVTQRVLILFFDDEHIEPGAFKRLQTAAVDFLRKQFQEGDIGGVVVNDKMVGNRLTSSREALVAGIQAAKPNAGRGFLRQDLQDWPRITQVEAIRIAINFDQNVLRQVVDRATREAPQGRREGYEPNVMEKARFVTAELGASTRRTINTLDALVNGLGRIPGRKTVVLLSDGFFVEATGGSIRDIVGLAARSNVRFYSIDALGQNRRQPDTPLDAMNPMETTGQVVSTGAYDTTEDATNSLAVDTGGFVVRNNNDFGSALERVSRDTSEYYVLGYSPGSAAADGKFHSITVRVKRPGTSVRARKGYVAAAPGAARPEPPPSRPPAPAAAEPRTPAQPGAGEPTAAGAPTSAGAAPPAPAPARESASPPAAASGSSAGAVALRPDASRRVEELAGGRLAGKTAATEGWDRYSKGDLEAASRLLGQAAAEPNSAPWISYALGFAELGLGQGRKAIDAWERVRKGVPEFEPVWLDLADAHLQIDDVGGAIAVLRDAERRWPGDAEVLNALGTAEVRRGALDDAITTFKRATEKSPKDALAYFNLGRTYELRYYKMRRFSRPDERWVANTADLAAALHNYQAYVQLGGPYETQARAAVERLQWQK